MEWQKWTFITGCRTGKIIGLDVRGRKCTKCHYANKQNLPVRYHNCFINYAGAIGVMVANISLSLTK